MRGPLCRSKRGLAEGGSVSTATTAVSNRQLGVNITDYGGNNERLSRSLRWYSTETKHRHCRPLDSNSAWHRSASGTRRGSGWHRPGSEPNTKVEALAGRGTGPDRSTAWLVAISDCRSEWRKYSRFDKHGRNSTRDRGGWWRRSRSIHFCGRTGRQRNRGRDSRQAHALQHSVQYDRLYGQAGP